MKWRRIDEKLLETCLFQLQKDITDGRTEIVDRIESIVGKSDEHQSLARKSFFAWRMYLSDRLREESEKNGWNKDETNPADELDEDRKIVGVDKMTSKRFDE